MQSHDAPRPVPTWLPEFRVADREDWPGDPDFDTVDLLLQDPRHSSHTIWSPQGGDIEVVTDVTDLAGLVASLVDNRFGVAKRRIESRIAFAQTLRVGDVWLVEVHDGTAADWASRVLSAERTTPPGELDPIESFTAGEAADIMWSWLAGTLPDGLRREQMR